MKLERIHTAVHACIDENASFASIGMQLTRALFTFRCCPGGLLHYIPVVCVIPLFSTARAIFQDNPGRSAILEAIG